MYKPVKVLDKGFVQLIDSMGDDRRVVDAARVSFNKDGEYVFEFGAENPTGYYYNGEIISYETKKEIDSKDQKLIQYMMNNGHSCYDEQTEVFTDKGWKFWKDLDGNEKLAAVDRNFSFRFEVPKRLICSDYDGDMVSFSSANISLLVTPNHKIFVSRRKSNRFGEYELMDADSYPPDFRMSAVSKYCDDNLGTEHDYNYGVLYGMFLGDGSIRSKNTVEFRFKKKRKIILTESMLNNLGISFKKNVTSDGVTEIYFFNPDTNLFCGRTSNKRIDRYMLYSSERFREGLVFGLKSSDGSVKRNAWVYSSKSLDLIKDIQELLTLQGNVSRINKMSCGVYRLMIFSRSLKPRLDSRTGNIERVRYSGKVYCAEVSTGLLLVRRNGKQIVSGNSPFEHVVFTFVIKCPLFVRSQIQRSRTFSYNEISRRYTSDDIEFYIPDKLRKQADTDRQASKDEYVETLYWNEPYYVEHGEVVSEFLRKATEYNLWAYETMLDCGVAREQARMVLPQNLYTRFYMTGNLHNWFHFLDLRCSPHAQYETREFANVIKDTIKNIVPVCFEAWEKKNGN